MRIKKVEIKNFRTLHDVIIDFHNITTFIGPNGSGKSTVLYALDWFFNGSKDGELTEEDATYHHEDEPIEVRVTFDKLTDSDKKALGKYSPQSTEEFTAWKTYSNGREFLSANSKGNPLFNEVKKASDAKSKRAEYAKIRSEHPELDLQDVKTRASIDEQISAWEQSHSDQLEDIPEEVSTSFNGFNGNAAMRNIFNFTLVKADYRASEESEDSRASILGSIIERTVNRSAADEKVQKLYASIKEQRAQIYSDVYGKQLVDLSGKLNSIMESYSAGRAVTIIPEAQEIKPPKTSFGVRAYEGKDETEITKQGHGFQRMLLISALQLLAETSSPEENNGTLCLAIEEPELYQHPIQARTFANVLRILGENENRGIQIMYDTHSPYFLDSQHYDQIYRVIRRHEENTTVNLYNTTEEKVDEKVTEAGFKSVKNSIGKTICNDLASALFSNVVILVEGSSDKAILEEVANRYFDSATEFCKYGIQIIMAGGKSNIPKLHAILNNFGIVTLAMFDNDQSKKFDASPVMIEMDKSSKEISKKISDSKAMATENEHVSRYFGIEGECGDSEWPQSNLYSGNSIFIVEDNLEKFMEHEWSGWEEALCQSRNELGIDNKKNEMTYRLAVQKLSLEACPPKIISFLRFAMNAAKRLV